MAPIAGWYDDPRDATRLRYWDGGAWTDEVTLKEQATAAPQWNYPGAPPAQQQTWQYGTPPPQSAQGAGSGGGSPSTPDGVRIATWVKRFAARLLDVIFVAIGGLPVTGYFVYRYYGAIMDQLNNGKNTSLLPTAEVIRWEVPLVAVFLALQVGYETFCLYRWGATPGKRVMEISVRTYQEGGQLAWPTIARRVGFMYGLATLNLVPALSLLAVLLGILNYLWPLWDKRRQALHDKVAGTVVVEGHRQPARVPVG